MPNLQSTPPAGVLPSLSGTKQAPAQTPIPTLPQSTAQIPLQTPIPAKDQVNMSPVNNQGTATPTVSLEPAEPQFTEYKVRRGDTLADIAKELLGSSNKHMDIFNANRDALRNPHDLKIGMTLKIPVPADSRPPVKPDPKPQTPAVKPDTPVAPVQPEPEVPNKEYTVRRGDNLSSIALETLGDSERYMEIYQANRDVMKDPDALRLGMKLKIPQRNVQAPSDGGKAPVVSHPAVTGPVDASGLTPGAQELFAAMQRYQQHHAQLGNTNRTQTSQAELKEIATELDAASKAFNVDPKMMLALFAHESGGINPGARSHTGAGGLGQLTSIAIRQVHFMAGIGKGNRGEAPYTEHKGNFVQSSRTISQRYDIKANVWTATAYMSYELTDRARLGRGVENALKRYGDPNVPTYANKVNAEYKTLFGGKLF